LVALNWSGSLSDHFVVFSPLFQMITGFSVKYLTGHYPKLITSGKSIIDLLPIAIIGTMNYSLSVTITRLKL
jgi:hypothetical protein